MTEDEAKAARKAKSLVLCETHPFGHLRITTVRQGVATLALYWVESSKQRFRAPVADLRAISVEDAA